MALEGSDGAIIGKNIFTFILEKSFPKPTGQFQSNVMQIILA
jgi:hypothetical protein